MAPRGAVVRHLQSLQIGAFKAMEARGVQDYDLGLNEVDLQYQVQIDGTATATPAFATSELLFEWEFHSAPSNRDSDLLLPQMTCGAYIHQGGPLIVTACVVSWQENQDNGGITGCEVGIGVMNDSLVEVPFGGFVHLTFQGYALSLDNMEDNPDLIEGSEQPRTEL